MFAEPNLGQIEESEAISRKCLEPLSAFGLNSELSECIHNLGVNASFRGEYELAMEQLERAILLGKESQNSMWPTYLLWLGHAYFLLGEYERGLESLQKCYEIFERLGNYWGMAFASSKMGLAADGLGEFAKAMEYHRQAMIIFENTNNQTGKGYALSRMSESAYFLEEYQLAVQLANQGHQIFKSYGRDGFCEVHCNTMEGIWTGLRNFLRPFRGVHKKYLAAYVAMFEWAHNLKRVTGDFLRTLMMPDFTYLPI